MNTKAIKTTVLNPPTSVMDLVPDLDAELAGRIEFLLMETKVNEELLAEERARLRQKLPYNQVPDLMAQVSLRCSILARHYQELDRAFDRMLELAPDVEE
jgi:hypothetical protein